MQEFYIGLKTTVVFRDGESKVFLPLETSYVYLNVDEVLFVEVEKGGNLKIKNYESDAPIGGSSAQESKPFRA